VLRGEASIEVNRPAADVWAYIANLDNLPRWDPGGIKVDWQTPLAVGSTFTIYVRAGVLLIGDGRVLECQQGEKIGWVSSLRSPRWLGKGGSVRALFTTTAMGESRTLLTRRIELAPRGLLRLATPLFALLLRHERNVAEEIVNIKAILERDASRHDEN
jgi:uncharacterized membrane protein